MNLKAYQKQLKKETLLNAALTSLRWTGLAIIICAIVWWCCGLGLIWIIPIINTDGMKFGFPIFPTYSNHTNSLRVRNFFVIPI